MQFWKFLGRIRLLEWAIGRVGFYLGLGVVIMAALTSWIQEMSLFSALLFCLGAGTVLGLISLGLSILWGKCRSARPKPCLVIPEYVRDDRGYEGLRLTNEGSCAVLNVFIEPLQIGNQTVEFGGPEVTYLKAKETCFFRLENVPPALLLRNWKGGSTLMGVLWKWQKALGDDWGATIEGRITYEDIQKSEGETRFKVGPDVEAEMGISVTVI